MFIKKLTPLLAFLCFISTLKNHAYQIEFNKTSKYKQFGLIWGLYKYHHPKVSRGKYNWNQIFLKNILIIDTITNQNQFNNLISDFTSNYKDVKPTTNNNSNLITKNVDYKWIDSLNLSKEIKDKLLRLSKNSNIGDFYTSFGTFNKIPSFKNEKRLKKFNFKTKGHRLLSFFSFWNTIQYFYVNKYLMNTPWYEQIDNYLLKFLSCNSIYEYEKLKSKLISNLDDSHSFHISPILINTLFKYKPGFDVKMINDTLVITSIYNKYRGKSNNLKLRDLILEVDDMSIKKSLHKRVGNYISHSNTTFLENWTRFMFFNDTDSIKVKIKRDENILSQYIKLYDDFSSGDFISIKNKKIKKNSKLITKKIGYINLAVITKKELKNSFKKFQNTKGIIIDLRNYPKNISEQDIAKQLYPNKKTFINVLMPVKNKPSFTEFSKAPLNFIKNPFKAGSKNTNYYKGKIVLLVNQYTQSKAEYFGMLIQGAPNCITVGKQTAGSAMNIATYTMPDNTKINFTSMGAFYPNGKSVEGKGLKINYKITETTSNFEEDQYILKALTLIKQTF